MDPSALHGLAACEAARLVREGVVSSEQLVEACLARVRQEEAGIQAWAFLNEDHALAQARAADALRLGGSPTGPLHGVSVGVADVFDTADLPTELGSALHAGRTPSRDATAVAMLRGAGAVILGKTATAELGAEGPGRTRHPQDRERTAGGSCGGSAAAVALGMAPLAIDRQASGSAIGAAAFCGVVGFKPTHGLVPRHGMLALSRTLDHVALFARTVDDAALLAAHLAGHDERDPDTRPRARIPFVEVAAEEPPLPPMLALVKTRYWERLDEDTREGFAELAGHLGDRLEEIELLPSVADAWQWHQTILDAEMAASLERHWERGRDQLSPALRARLERGRAVLAVDYQRALARAAPMAEGFLELFEQRYDAILTPAAPGVAPMVSGFSEDPTFVALWTLCGMPAVSLPLLEAPNGLPLGVQLVGPRHGDARLLRTARWLSSLAAAG